MRMRTKFAVVLTVITVVLSLAMLGGLEFYKRNQIGDVQRSVNETANLTASQIGADLRQRKDTVGYVASQPQARQFDGSDEYLDAFLDNSRFFAGQVIDANGTVVAFRGGIREDVRERALGSDVSSETYVRKAMEGRTYMSEVEYADRPDKHLVTISAPIVDADRNVVGVLAAAIYLTEETVFDSVRPLGTSEQSVLITNGSAVLNARERTFEQRIVGTAVVPEAGWRVVLSRDASGLVRELQWLAIAQGGGVLGLLSLVVGFGYWQYVTNLRQTERLLDAFDQLQRGNFDYPLSFTAAEEWEQISDGFNEMTTGLREREQAIREREQRLGVLNRVLRHNLQNDMSVVLTYAEMLPQLAGDEQKEAVDTILSKGRGLVEHGKKARQIEEAMESAERGLVALDAVSIVEDALDEYGAANPDVTVRRSLPDRAPVAAIESFDYAVDNVVENAFEHNDSADPVVEAAVTDDGDGRTVIRISDNGPGIPEYEQRVFAGESEETSLEHGSGIGLWLVYWVTGKSGGRLRFDDGIDGGTTIELGLDPAPEGAVAGEPIEDADPAGATAVLD